MRPEKIDFSSLEKALASLDVAIARSQLKVEDLEIRDAVIQRFEYCYELSWKMLKRQIEKEHPSPSEVDAFSFSQLLREGLERGLIEEFDHWLVYRSARNATSHAYDDRKAQEVYQTALAFRIDAQRLLKRLKAHADSQ